MATTAQLVVVSSIINFMFFTSGVDKCIHFPKVVNGLKKRFPVDLYHILYQVMIVGVIAIELLAPIIILYSIFNPSYKRYGVYSCYALVTFTVLATLLYHFPPTNTQWYPFTSNITTVGGLFALSMLLRTH